MNLSFHIAFTCQTVAYRLCRTLYFFIRKCVARKYYLCIFLLLCPIFMQHLYLKRIAQCRINGLKCTFIYIFRHSQTILLQKSPIFICIYLQDTQTVRQFTFLVKGTAPKTPDKIIFLCNKMLQTIMLLSQSFKIS